MRNGFFLRTGFLLVCGLISLHAPVSFSEEANPDYVLDINLDDFCKSDEDVQAAADATPTATPVQNNENENCATCNLPKDPTLSFKVTSFPMPPDLKLPAESKKNSCVAIQQMGAQTNYKPIEFNQKAKIGSSLSNWKIRVHFGIARTGYLPSDVAIRGKSPNAVVKNFVFDEKNWKEVLGNLMWDARPTHTMIFEIQKGKDEFFINIYRPKYLASGDAFMDGTGPSSVDQQVENQHKETDWQIGYGRRLDLVDFKTGKVLLVPHVAVGVTSGKTKFVFNPDQHNDMREESHGETLGRNFSLGSRLEYDRKKFSIFLDESMTFSQQKDPLSGDQAFYGLRYLSNSIGISIKLDAKKKH